MAATRNHSCSSCECDLIKRGLDTALLLLLKIGRLPPEAHLSLTSAMMDLAGFKESLAARGQHTACLLWLTHLMRQQVTKTAPFQTGLGVSWVQLRKYTARIHRAAPQGPVPTA